MDATRLPQLGEPIPELTALTSEGEDFSLANALEQGKNIALIFYRGHW